jgi:hypothetical protein
VEFTVIYRAVFVRYLQQGLQERDTRQRAATEIRGYLGKGSSPASRVRLLSASTGQTPNGQDGHSTNGHNGGVKQGIRAFLDANPGLKQQLINQVLAALKEARIQGGRTTVGKVLQERKQQVMK